MVPRQSKWSLYWMARHKPYWIVILTGILLAASFPPSPANFLIFVAFVPLFILFETEVVPERVPEDKIFRPFKSSVTVLFRIATLQFLWRRATRFGKVFSYRRKVISGNAQLFRYSYTIFLIWNLLCCYWLVFTVAGAGSLREVLVSTVAGILALMINPALMSIPFQFFSRMRWILPPTLAPLSLIVFWISFEYLHLNWDLSWSWLNLGHALTPWPQLIQYAEFTGVLGITLHILLVNYLFYRLYRRLTHKQGKLLPPLVVALAWLLLPLGLNLLILNPDRAVFQPSGSLNVRVVQPNIDPYLKRNYYTPENQVEHLVELSLQDPLDNIDLLVYPETAIPRPIEDSSIVYSRLMRPMWALVDSFQLDILTGVESFHVYPDGEEVPGNARQTIRGEWIENFNAAVALKGDRNLDLYAKTKLIPLVEAVPFPRFLDFLDVFGFSSDILSYGTQDSIVNLSTSSGKEIGVMICYDSEFGEHVTRSTQNGAELLAIITNDGWWGNTSGYIQHAYMTSLRAIENRRAIVRSANTGISLFADVKGYLGEETQFWEEAVIDQEVNLYQGETFYMKHGDYLGRIALLLTLIISVLGIAWTFFGPRR